MTLTEYCGYKRPTLSADSCPKSDDVIHIVLAVYDPSGTYSQHAGVTMTSIFENTHSKVTVHILHDDTLTDDNRQKFIRTAEKYSQGIELHDVTEYREKVSKETVSSVTRTLGTLYRLFIPDAIAADRVIYLDCDILVNMDIKELWDIDTEENILTGVPGFLHGMADVLRKKLCEIDHRSYINAGVLIMEVGKIRSCGNLFRMSEEWFSKHSQLATLADQDALNSIFRGHIKIISRKYNNSRIDEDLSDSIVHTWPHKSWRGLAGFRSDALYWKFFLRSAWGENITGDELIDILNNTAFRNRPQKSAVRRAVSFAKKKILFWQPVRIMRFLFREAKYRLTRR